MLHFDFCRGKEKENQKALSHCFLDGSNLQATNLQIHFKLPYPLFTCLTCKREQ